MERQRQWNGMYCQFHTCVSILKRFPEGCSSFLGLGSETKWYSTDKERPGRKWDRVAELTTTKFGESRHPVFRASPFSRGMLKSKGGASVHFCADGDNIETVFRAIICVNQLSIYGAVSDLCAAYSSCQTRTGRLVVAEQSNPFFAPANLIMTPTPSIEIPAQENLLQKHKKCMCNLDHRRRFLKKISWTCNLDSDVGRSNKDIQRIELFANPITNYQVQRDLLQKWSEETLERTKFDRDTLNQEKRDNVTDPTSTESEKCTKIRCIGSIFTRMWTRIHRTLRVDT